MAMPLTRFFVAGLALASLASCRLAGGNLVRIDEKSSGSTLELRQGQILQVSLPGNPSTGYAWEAPPGAQSIVAQQGPPQFVASSSAVGAGGVVILRFKAVAQGKAALTLVYHRPWELAVPPAETFEVMILVIP